MNDIQVVQALMPTYAELATSRTLLERAIAFTGVKTTADKLATEITTHVPIGTSILEVTVTDRDSQAAALVANEIASQLAKFELPGRHGDVRRRDDPHRDGPGDRLDEVDGPAGPCSAPRSAAAIGFVMAVAFAFTVENLLQQARPGHGQHRPLTARPLTGQSVAARPARGTRLRGRSPAASPADAARPTRSPSP